MPDLVIIPHQAMLKNIDNPDDDVRDAERKKQQGQLIVTHFSGQGFGTSGGLGIATGSASLADCWPCVPIDALERLILAAIVLMKAKKNR